MTLILLAKGQSDKEHRTGGLAGSVSYSLLAAVTEYLRLSVL